MFFEDSVLTTREYGRIRLLLRERMDERGISRGALARRINTRFEVVEKWYNGDLSKMDLDILARICFTLKCDISDLMEYVPQDIET